MTINTKYLALLAALLLLPAGAFAQTIATFTVYKNWSNNEDSDRQVDVNISCTGGTNPNLSSPLLTDNIAVQFEIENLNTSGRECVVTEDEPKNYNAYYNCNDNPNQSPDSSAATASCDDSSNGYDGCRFYSLNDSTDWNNDSYVCLITNISEYAKLEVTKTWDLAGADQGFDAGYKLKVDCDNYVAQCVTKNNGNHYEDDPNGTAGFCKDFREGFSNKHSLKDEEGTSDELYVFIVRDPDTDEICDLEEESTDSVVESSFGDCGKGTSFNVSVKKSGKTKIKAAIGLGPGEKVECEIINTVFFEGIPTLSEYGMAILALLMLGVGFVGFRRFV